ncbi:MAG: Ppx/GppA phosphatase family protein [Candidatus Poribacteria bacterium]|nr:Ppx/GppA phosphatase family protein [Candidatus Poribacteria bacterium]
MQPTLHNRNLVIDVGTNSVHMLVCDVGTNGQKPKIVLDDRRITRLGHGLALTHELQEEAMARTCATLRDFAVQAGRLGVEQIVAVGTSALREARNAVEFVKRVENQCGIEIEIISGETEARCAFLSIRSDTYFSHLNGDHIMVIDIGGGSTEIIVGRQEVDSFMSVNLGAVYLTETFLASDPPTAEELGALYSFLEETWSTQPVAGARFNSAPALMGIGGTIVNLAGMKLGLPRFDLRLLHGEMLHITEIENQIRRLCSVPLDERKRIPGLEVKRADIISAGAAVLRSILKHFGASRIRVSTHGLRYGVMYDRFISQSNGI